jgi:hypothetical protein
METPRRERSPQEDHSGGAGRPLGAGGGGATGSLLLVLTAVACPLLCLGPVLLAGLASTGLVRALQGAPWPLIAGAVLTVIALGVWGGSARLAGACCMPPPTPLVGDETPR